jgi:hypothetical protein
MRRQPVQVLQLVGADAAVPRRARAFGALGRVLGDEAGDRLALSPPCPVAVVGRRSSWAPHATTRAAAWSSSSSGTGTGTRAAVS